jgi:GTP-binding protein
VSNTPGRTREINFFNINGEFLIADLPGYGYARVSKEARARWSTLIDAYVRDSAQLRGLVLLVDARHDPSDDDHRVLAMLADVGVPVLIVATKCDKLRPRARAARVAALASALGVAEDSIVPVSSVTGEGRDELAAALVALIQQPSWRS